MCEAMHHVGTKCCLVDFCSLTQVKPQLQLAFFLPGPCTCVSVVSAGKKVRGQNAAAMHGPSEKPKLHALLVLQRFW